MESNHIKIIKVAIENTNYTFDKFFDYIVPNELAGQLIVGSRVLIPFGAGNKKRQGVVFAEEIKSKEDKEKFSRVKKIFGILDEKPLLNQEMLALAIWMKKRYYCTLFEAVKSMLPVGLSLKIIYHYSVGDNFKEESLSRLNDKELRVYNFLKESIKLVSHKKLIQFLNEELDIVNEKPFIKKLIDLGAIVQIDDTLRKTKDAKIKMVSVKNRLYENKCKLTQKQQLAYDFIACNENLSLKEICYQTGITSAVIDALVKKEILEYYQDDFYRNPYNIQKEPVRKDLVLTSEQNKVYKSLYDQYKSENAHVALLYGITGSGKTSVFMRLIDDAVCEDRGVILMVPEIALTPQMINIFKVRFSNHVAVFHSGLSIGERFDEWKRVKNGEAKIVIGTRSAVFAPIDNIGLIIIDEEQEYTYKSDASPRFHARDIAKFRCKNNNCLLLLGSATPSIESFYAAQSGKYSFHKLTKRYGDAKLPKVKIIDMNKEVMEGSSSQLSSELLKSLRVNLENGRQSILLLNRRGYQTFASCRLCGEVVSCPNCSISLIYHKANERLMCHYCGYSIEFTKKCPQCNEEQLKYAGIGTQKAQQDIEALISGARILRMDADTTMSKLSHQKKFKEFRDGKYDIMIGTQMVAKGLDFPNVTLVGVLLADQSLYGDDFRSYERAFALITQVVGRAGRGNSEGTAVIQTYTPENPIIKLAAEQNYDKFFESEIQIRKALLYPPFSDICVITFAGVDKEKSMNAANYFSDIFKMLAKNEYSKIPLRALGPSPALVHKVNNKYRYKFIIKFREGKSFREMMSRLLNQFKSNKDYIDINIVIDVNPDLV